jgi:hypothetical protein
MSPVCCAESTRMLVRTVVRGKCKFLHRLGGGIVVLSLGVTDGAEK